MVLLQKKRAVLARPTQKSATQRAAKTHTQKFIQTVFTKNREMAYRSTSQFRRYKITRGRVIAGLPSLDPVSNAGYWIQLAVHVFHKITVGFQMKHNGVTRLESSSTGELSLSWIPIFSFIVVNTATWLESSSKICIDSNHRAGFQSPFSSPSFGCLGSCVSLLLAPCVRA